MLDYCKDMMSDSPTRSDSIPHQNYHPTALRSWDQPTFKLELWPRPEARHSARRRGIKTAAARKVYVYTVASKTGHTQACRQGAATQQHMKGFDDEEICRSGRNVGSYDYQGRFNYVSNMLCASIPGEESQLQIPSCPWPRQSMSVHHPTGPIPSTSLYNPDWVLAERSGEGNAFESRGRSVRAL